MEKGNGNVTKLIVGGNKLSFVDLSKNAPTSGLSRSKNYRKCEYFKAVNLVVLEKSLEILFAECRNNVSCPLTRWTNEKNV